ncbi:MAG: DNA mismatch repair protein MutS [Proteobacteria bacterium]|nr:DNA mismatch repair protein MutS [Desulfobulbaceae bacterium]MBU4154278.1 DNA mismatch repair protein MutS [Pseudomonadota bacterium]
MTDQAKITPMLRQYLEIKALHPDAILFYRLGDFYEMFFDDAKTASRVLGITLTSRNSKDDENKVPLCGVPYHAAANYLAKLVRAGFKVAVCEQVEDPKTAKGVVKREVVRVITPGLITEEGLLDDKNNVYVAAVAPPDVKTDASWGLSLLDLSTGEFMVGEFDDLSAVIDELCRQNPAELVLPAGDERGKTIAKTLAHTMALCVTERHQDDFLPHSARHSLLEHFNTTNLAGFGCEQMIAGANAAGALFTYIRDTQKADLSHIERLTPLLHENLLIIDDSSRRNLEITQTIVGGKREGSLLATLDFTQTPMGARLLKKSLLFPLQDPRQINRRLETVNGLFHDAELRDDLRSLLTRVYDLERLNSRLVLGSGNARDLTALKHSLGQLPQIKTRLAEIQVPILMEIASDLDPLTDLFTLLEASIREDAPITLREGHLIKSGYNQELDEIIAILTDGKQLILDLENQEKARSGINTLKIGYNRVFGYYLEVSKAQMANVPDYFIRKQTLANAERFITPELKEFEGKVLGAQEKRVDLEHELFLNIRTTVAAESARVLKTAAHLAQIDLMCCLAEAARKLKYVRPHVDNGEEIIIEEGRHPVIEVSLPPGRFVPNDIHLDQENHEVLIITGPNMAGKSTVLRQTALIVLMAQVGSFVPAASARIGVVDRIFTRVGAMDNLRQGQSTFMVEMNETANILNNATEKSLVILDEIGRGTSTFDGLSIAWAVTEDLVNKNGRGVKTIFATHYHELTELAMTNQRIKNFNIGVREWNNTIIFLHKLLTGGTNRSYGIQVAALAGVPAPVIERAKELLHNIEKGELNQYGKPKIAHSISDKTPDRPCQLPLFAATTDPLYAKLEGIEPDRLSPIEALTLLYELKALSVTS